jgi:hypothetical protein
MVVLCPQNAVTCRPPLQVYENFLCRSEVLSSAISWPYSCKLHHNPEEHSSQENQPYPRQRTGTSASCEQTTRHATNNYTSRLIVCTVPCYKDWLYLFMNQTHQFLMYCWNQALPSHECFHYNTIQLSYQQLPQRSAL